MLVNISELDLSFQTRCGTDAETVANYAEAMADGAEFPKVTVFETEDGRKILADGFHRVMAAKENGRTTIQAEVKGGTEADAILFGGTANSRQGKRPTRADQQHFLEMVWERRETYFGGTPTGGNFAKKCGVSNDTGTRFVNARLAEMPSVPKKAPTAMRQVPMVPVRPKELIGADGKHYPVRQGVKVVTKTETHLVPVDRYGVEIPIERQAAFDGKERLREVIMLVSQARVAVRDARENGDIAFGAVRQETVVCLNNAFNYLTSALPHCVCRMCQGQGCQACHERGWQTAEEHERNPEEFRGEDPEK